MEQETESGDGWQVKKRMLYRKHKLFIMAACCLFFILAVIGIFTVYQNLLNERFCTVLTDELEKNIRDQKNYIGSAVTDLQAVLEMLEDTDSGMLTDEWELLLYEKCVSVDYLEKQQFLDMVSSSQSADTEKKISDRLMAGAHVVTGLGESCFTDNSSFALLNPVFKNGSLIGVLRAQVDGALLTEGNNNSDSMFQKVYTILTTADGDVVYANMPYADEPNLFSSAVHGGMETEEMEAIQQSFKKDSAKTVSFCGKGNQYYMSWESLDLNDWRIVRFARSPDVMLQTTTILKGMIFTGICLIVLTLIFGIVLLQLLLHQKRQLETQQRRYDALAQFNDTLLFDYDVPADQIIFTPNALECLDLDGQCLEGISGEYCMEHLLHPEDRNTFYKSLLTSGLALGETGYLEVRFRCQGEKYHWFGCQFKSIENRGQNTIRLIGKLVDISDQRGREQLLRRAALTDVLTGVYNRAAETIINKQLEKNELGLLFMIDLDNFKTVNDTYGHAYGDALLINVAQILRKIFRPDDIIARVGGDEFAVFISGTNNPAVAERKAEVIQSRMAELQSPGSVHFVSASIGAAMAPRDGDTYEALTHAADQAMYKIKKGAKKGFAFHDYEDDHEE